MRWSPPGGRLQLMIAIWLSRNYGLHLRNRPSRRARSSAADPTQRATSTGASRYKVTATEVAVKGPPHKISPRASLA